MLRFAVYDWDSAEVTDDTKGQDNLGTMECSLAEIVKQSGKRVRNGCEMATSIHVNNVKSGKNIIFNSIFQYERGLSPYRREPGDCGVMVVYAEEKSGLKDKVGNLA